jgi:hypothetical protein
MKQSGTDHDSPCMKTFIALCRGINIGGHHPLPMKELTAILQDLGATAVVTYIQSGNAVFQSALKIPARSPNDSLPRSANGMASSLMC